MTSLSSYFIFIPEESTQEIDMLKCEFDGEFREWFLMIKVSGPDEDERFVYRDNLTNYNNTLKNIAI